MLVWCQGGEAMEQARLLHYEVAMTPPCCTNTMFLLGTFALLAHQVSIAEALLLMALRSLPSA